MSRNNILGHRIRRRAFFGMMLSIAVLMAWNYMFNVTTYEGLDVQEEPLKSRVSRHNKSPNIKNKQRPLIRIRSISDDNQENRSNPNMVKVSATVAAQRGKELLRDGNLPALEGDIELPFPTYLAVVEQAGGKLVVFDRQANRIIGVIEDGSFNTDVPKGRYARRARDVTEDIPRDIKQKYFSMIEKSWGSGAYRLLILLSHEMEATFMGSLAEALGSQEIIMEDLDLILFSYKEISGNLYIEIRKVIQQGKTIPVGLMVRLWF